MKVATLHEFCRACSKVESSGDVDDPEALATEFVLRFGVSKRPKLEELKRLMLLGGFRQRAGPPPRRDAQRGSLRLPWTLLRNLLSQRHVARRDRTYGPP